MRPDLLVPNCSLVHVMPMIVAQRAAMARGVHNRRKYLGIRTNTPIRAKERMLWPIVKYGSDF